MTVKTIWAGLLSALGLGACSAETVSYSTTDVATLKAAQEAGAYVLDVRTQGEYTGGHIAGSHLIPMQELRGRLAEVPQNQDVYVICRSGNRSAKASQLLLQAGKTPINVAGGMNAWARAGYAVER